MTGAQTVDRSHVRTRSRASGSGGRRRAAAFLAEWGSFFALRPDGRLGDTCPATDLTLQRRSSAAKGTWHGPRTPATAGMLRAQRTRADTVERPPSIATAPRPVRVGVREYDPPDRIARVLLIDDDLAFLPEQVRQAFPAPNHLVTSVATGALGMERVRTAPPDVILLDLRLPDQSGLSVFAQIRAIDARIPVIFITGAATADTAIEAMKQGAFNYLQKPLDLQQLKDVVREALDVAERMRLPVVLTEAADDGADGAFIGSSKPMLEACKAIGRVSAQDVPVLITGESGTGKELVARAIYQHSGTSPGAVSRAELRRHPGESPGERAVRSRAGCVHRRRPASRRQVRAVQRRHDLPRRDRRHAAASPGEDSPPAPGADFQRVGWQRDRADRRARHRGNAPGPARASGGRKVSSRTSTTDLRCARSTFRRFASVAAIFRSLARHFLARYNREFGKEVREVAPDAMTLLSSYAWPGNIRELQSVLKQALLRANGSVLLAGFLPDLSLGRAGLRAADRVRSTSMASSAES